MISIVTKAVISFLFVPGDDTWVYQCIPEKMEHLVWKHFTQPSQRKFKTTLSAGKAVTTIYWDINGDMLFGATVTAGAS
jgi:hypothetical protein